MSKSLVIVESPAKAKTIKKYLGKDFSVEASSGHLIDLPNNKLGVNIEKNFKPEYVVIKNKKKFLDQLEKASKKADNIYLASDPDREGEAIAWHIVDRLKIKDKAYRVLIYEITEKAVLEAIRNPSRLSRDMFEAQQARRILDRLVGYQVSPLLWKKVRRGLSAGRVQSVALRLVVEREREVENFKSDEYWTIEAELKQLLDDAISFVAVLSKYDGEKVDIKMEEAANRAVEALRNETYNVISVEKKERSRSAPPPFITSTLQQEASRKLRFPVKKSAQDAHEAISPTTVIKSPDSVKIYLSEDEFELYKLIWQRFISCQMNPALYDQTTVEIEAGKGLFRATGSVIKFPGFTIVYMEGKEEEEEAKEISPFQLQSL